MTPPDKKSPDALNSSSDVSHEAFTAEQLRKLQEEVGKGNFENVIDELIESTVKGGEIPSPAKIDTFVQSLDPAKRQAFVSYLASNSNTENEKALHFQITKKNTPSQKEEVTGPAKKIIDIVDKKIEELGIENKISEIGKKFGFIGEVGPKQIEFLKKIFMDILTKVCENILFSVASFSTVVEMKDILKAPLQLRLMQIKQENADDYGVTLEKLKESYEKAYIAEANRARKSKGKFVPPTLDEVMAPKPLAPSQPEVQPLATGEKIEGTRTVTLTDKTTFEITHNDKKIIVKAAGNTAEVKVKGGKVLDVQALDAKDQKNAIVTLKLIDNSSITVDAERLRNAVQKKETSLQTPEGTTIELLLQNS